MKASAPHSIPRTMDSGLLSSARRTTGTCTARPLFHLAADVEAGQPRHDDIGKDQVEVRGVEEDQGLLPIRGDLDIERVCEEGPEMLGLRGTILDDQDSEPRGGVGTGGHRGLLSVNRCSESRRPDGRKELD